VSSCEGLVGLEEAELVRRLGSPVTRREAGNEVWLVFRSPEMSLRVRLTGGDTPRLASWTASFDPGHAKLSEATRAVGLWPAAAPDEDASSVDRPLVRRALRCPTSARVHSLTATVRNGRFTAVSVFDEPPDWL
jgi:hypothetical protein